MKMVLSRKCCLTSRKSEFHPQDSQKNLCVVPPSAPRHNTGWLRQGNILWGSLAGQPSLIGDLQANKRPCLRRKGDGSWGAPRANLLSLDLDMHVHEHMHTTHREHHNRGQHIGSEKAGAKLTAHPSLKTQRGPNQLGKKSQDCHTGTWLKIPSPGTASCWRPERNLRSNRKS